MAGLELKIKDQTIVIMDASDRGLNRLIVNLIWLIALEEDDGYYDIYPIGGDCSLSAVIKFKATDEDFQWLQNEIDERHPGLCMFNPPMHV